MPAPLIHGEARVGAETPEYRAWQEMKARCYRRTNKRWPQYGGRGIVVCDAWRNDYTSFLKYVGRRPSADHSIDRIDNDGPYRPGNVRWATRVEQGRNKRSNVVLTAFGRTHCLAEWQELLGIDSGSRTIAMRLRAGWSVERALSEPIRGVRRAS